MSPGAAAQQEWVPGWDACSEGGSPALPPPEKLVPNQAAEQVQLFFLCGARHVGAVGTGRGAPYLWKTGLAAGLCGSTWFLLKLYLVGDICGR